MEFCAETPANLLEEIIIVDDGSKTPLETLVSDYMKSRCKVKFRRHEDTLGLMVAKQTGGDAAEGEFVGFFDCHVKPLTGWETKPIELMRENRRRIITPAV